jgi:rhomboid protease GluP
MEEKISQKLDDLSRIDIFAMILVLVHIAYYVYAGIGHWTFWGGITAEGLDRSGALRTDLVDQGEFWRLWTSVFLHVGLLHLILNMMNLYFLVLMADPMVGKIRILMVYLLSGFTGSILSWTWETERTVGASGAIFGLMGLVLVIAYRERKLLQGRIGHLIRGQLLGWTVFSLILGWIVPMIDNASHVGGLLMGLSLGLFFQLVDGQSSSDL